jgi:hypothetical protein
MPGRFEKLLPPNRLLLLVGLVLTAISFWFPSDSPLHGGGGASLGLAMLIVAIWSTCRWSDVTLSTATAAICIFGSVWYKYNPHAGFVVSMVGVGLFVMAVLSYAYARLHRAGQT